MLKRTLLFNGTVQTKVPIFWVNTFLQHQTDSSSHCTNNEQNEISFQLVQVSPRCCCQDQHKTTLFLCCRPRPRMSVYLSVYLSFFLSFCWSVCLSYRFTYLSVRLSMRLSVHPSIYIPARLPTYIFSSNNSGVLRRPFSCEPNAYIS